VEHVPVQPSASHPGTPADNINISLLCQTGRNHSASSAYQANDVLMLLSLAEFTKIKDGKDF